MVKIMAIKHNTQFRLCTYLTNESEIYFFVKNALYFYCIIIRFPDILCEIVELLKLEKIQIKIFYVKMQKLK